MALVIQNGMFSAARTGPEGQKVVTLYTGKEAVRSAMKEFCVNHVQTKLWEKPSHDVEAYDNRIDVAKVKVRPSYLNAVLIQSRGTVGMTCESCAIDPNRGPFTECRRTKGYFEGCCGNCKWRDHGSRCSVRMAGEQSDDDMGQLPVGEGSQEPEVIVISDSE